MSRSDNCFNAQMLTSRTSTTAFIFTSYANHSGFSAKGYVYLLGWVLTSIATGQDIAAHLAEESVYPTKTVPRAIFWCTFLSYLAGYIVMLSIMAVSDGRGFRGLGVF